MGEFDRIQREPYSGSERFRDEDRGLGFDLLSFWQGSASDVFSNAIRGVLAEYLVARAIGAAYDVRDEWAVCDLCDPSGITIEVKSAAYLQSWHRERLSSISFNCAKTFARDAETNQLGKKASPCSSVRVCSARP